MFRAIISCHCFNTLRDLYGAHAIGESNSWCIQRIDLMQGTAMNRLNAGFVARLTSVFSCFQELYIGSHCFLVPFLTCHVCHSLTVLSSCWPSAVLLLPAYSSATSYSQSSTGCHLFFCRQLTTVLSQATCSPSAGHSLSSAGSLLSSTSLPLFPCSSSTTRSLASYASCSVVATKITPNLPNHLIYRCLFTSTASQLGPTLICGEIAREQMGLICSPETGQ